MTKSRHSDVLQGSFFEFDFVSPSKIVNDRQAQELGELSLLFMGFKRNFKRSEKLTMLVDGIHGKIWVYEHGNWVCQTSC